MSRQLQVSVVGGTGYTGVELLRILARHPQIALRAITSRSEAGTRVHALFPNLRGVVDLAFSEPDPTELAKSDLVFFATPNGTAMRLARDLVAGGARVIDLAADFRLKDPAEWEKWYGEPHACPDLLAEAVYGLPEINREAIAQARVIANPGCYPTAVILGLLPLIEAGWIDAQRLIADTKSGVSGAGRKAMVNGLMAECGESFKAYGIPGHRHLPEIRQILAQRKGGPVGLTFVPHLVPMVRGIEASLYAWLDDAALSEDLQALYENQYADEPFVDVLPAGSHPETRSVRGSNLCRIAVHRPQGERVVVVSSVIDNLVKGSAGQAVQNFNLMFDIEETTGLMQQALFP